MRLDEQGLDNAILKSVLASLPPEPEKVSQPDKRVEALDWNLAGFGGKARIRTVFGDLPIEALRIRDEIRTHSGKLARVQWLDKLELDDDFIQLHHEAWPVRIYANTFGPGKPMQDMIVSPCQDVCPELHLASRFLPADKLPLQCNARRLRTSGMTYYRFHFGEPVVVQVEGVWVRVQP